MKFLINLEIGGGFPRHALYMCKNAPIMLLCNVDPKLGPCNGTQLICKELHCRVIEVKIINGSHARDILFIQRIDFIIGSANGFPFEMKHREFSIGLAFRMTINKSQGKMLKVFGDYILPH